MRQYLWIVSVPCWSDGHRRGIFVYRYIAFGQTAAVSRPEPSAQLLNERYHLFRQTIEKEANDVVLLIVQESAHHRAYRVAHALAVDNYDRWSFSYLRNRIRTSATAVIEAHDSLDDSDISNAAVLAEQAQQCIIIAEKAVKIV